MAVDLNTIISWFQTGKKPTQNQYSDAWKSFWHKLEKIPTGDILNLDTVLNEKTDNTTFNFHLTDPNAHAELFASAAYVEISYDDARLLANSSLLKMGVLYKITGCDKNLYNFYDTSANEAGISVFTFALTKNTFSTEAWGEFFTPRYNLYYMYGPGWAFLAGEVCCWGGCIWEALVSHPTQGGAAALNDFELDPKIFLKRNSANDTKDENLYLTFYDKIKYDFLADQILYREDTIGNVVEADRFYLNTLNYDEHPIRVFKWGAHSASSYYESYYYNAKQVNNGGNVIRFSIFNNLNSCGFEWNNEIKNNARVIRFHSTEHCKHTNFTGNIIDGGFIYDSVPVQITSCLTMKRMSQIISVDFSAMTVNGNPDVKILENHVLNEFTRLKDIDWDYETKLITNTSYNPSYNPPVLPLSMLLLRSDRQSYSNVLIFYNNRQDYTQTFFYHSDENGNQFGYAPYDQSIYIFNKTIL